MNKTLKITVAVAAFQCAKQGNALPADTVISASNSIEAAASCINKQGLDHAAISSMINLCHPPVSTVTVTQVPQTIVELVCAQTPATVPVTAVTTELTVMSGSAFTFFKICPADVDAGNTCRVVSGTVFSISGNLFVNHVSP